MTMFLLILDLVLASLMTLSSTLFSVCFWMSAEYVRAGLWTVAALAWIVLLIKAIIDLVIYRRKKKRVDDGIQKLSKLLEDNDVKEVYIKVDKDACTIESYKVEISDEYLEETESSK